MENSKTLIVIVSVSLFVAAVLGLGLVLFYPRETPEVTGAGGQTGAADSFDPIEYLRDPEAEEPSLETEEETDAEAGEDDDVVIVYGETMEERPAEEPDEEAPAAEAQRPSEEAPARSAEPEAPSAAEEPQADQGRAARPETPSEPEAREATPAGAPPQRAPEPEPRRVTVTEYWIQVIATTSRDRVETARKRLTQHKLSGRITTKNVEGETFYRLRVGPYTEKREAEKFLDWVNDIEGFEESYISEEYSVRTVRG